jgi:Ca2+-transporting ATPase
MGVGTLAVISWAEQERTLAVAHTMGVVTFSLFALLFSVATRDELRTVLSLDTFSDRTFVLGTLASVGTLVLSTALEPLERLLDMTSLDAQQWTICSATAMSILLVAEVRKAVLRRSQVRSGAAAAG